MFTASEIVTVLERLGVTHVVWVPDSTFGQWEEALENSAAIRLMRVCREGEAWPLAAGLQLGGQQPIVVMQSTGFFESGDALRNVVYDLQLPLFAIVGARNWLHTDSPDSARRFIEPLVKAWEIEYAMIDSRDRQPVLEDHYRATRLAGRAGIALVAEGHG